MPIATLLVLFAQSVLPPQVAISGVPSAAASCTAGWVPTFGANNQLDYYASALHVFDDGGGPELYVGGDFTASGGAVLNGVAKWDGAGFEPVGAGPGSGVTVIEHCDTGSGAELYAAGSFGLGGGVARFSGASWQSLGAGLALSNPAYPGQTSFVTSIAAYDDGSGEQLYVAGFFDLAGGLPVQSFARWDGSSWSPVTPPPSGALDMVVFDAGSGPELFCAGNGVWSFGPGGWSDASSGSTYVTELHVYDDGTGPELFGAGRFGTPSFDPYDAARWDGSSWVRLNSPYVIAGVLGTFDSGGGPELHLHGRVQLANGTHEARIARWTGSSWVLLAGNLVSGSVPGGAGALVEHDDGSGNALFIAGGFTEVAGEPARFFAKYDGSVWSGAVTGLDDRVSALTTFDDGGGEALYAGGSFSAIAGEPRLRVAKWDGAAWSALGTGIGSGMVESLAVFDDGTGEALYAGGTFASAGGASASRIARWDGTSWSPLGSGVSSASGTTIVWALKAFDDGNGEKLFVGGRFTTAGGMSIPAIAAWDGSTWSAVGSGISGGPAPAVFALEVFDDGGGPDLYAGGLFTTAGGVSASSIARWDGTSWTALTSYPTTKYGNPSGIMALAVFDDGSGAQLCAGGSFDTIGGIVAYSLARWSATAWSALDASYSNSVRALRAFDDGGGEALFVAGFSLPAGVAVARWRGNWSTMIPELAYGDALEVFDDGTGPALFAAGDFQTTPSGDAYLAKYGCTSSTAPSAFCAVSGPTSNGCTATLTATGQPNLAHSAPCTLTATNVDGQRTGLLFYGVTGQLGLPWCSGGTSWMCVAGPRRRMTLMSSGGMSGACNGVLTQDWNAFQLANPGALGNPWSAGAVVDVQAWFRDPAACGGIALSPGVRLTYQ